MAAPSQAQRGEGLIRIANPKDFWAGILFIGVGLAAFAIAYGYPLGTSTRMGPGYFPRILGILLAGLGLVVLIRGIATHGPALGSWPWKPMLFILGSVAVFALTMPKIGLAAAGFVLVMISGFAAPNASLRSLLIFAVALSVTVASMFVYGLQLEIPIWPWSP
jgi:hypothetical protein